ncbi:MAG: DNA recombination protein RmuC [Candidatus Colwellbacteria bacterium]|nr:DNA recombination protein RmuC [Candidatus Colwellbacteria bacterium]
MDTVTLLLLIILGALAVNLFLLLRKKESVDDKSLLLLQNQMNEITRTLDSKLGVQFSQSREIIRDVTERLTKLDETNRQVVNFADQLRNMQDILKNPKQRGILGEYSLEVILQNYFPHNYERQYKFKDGTAVDFVIKIRDKVIPIDSKFSLENYQRLLDVRDEAERERLESAFKEDLKARIDETSKYIKPDEGTMDFAFMFIPAEAVYYDLLVNKIGAIKTNTRDLIEYAMGEKKVVIVSPSSFLAYLQTVMQGLKAMQIEESAKEIQKRVGELGRHLAGYESYMEKLGTHLGTTVNMYNNAYKELGKIDKDVLRISGEEPGIDPVVINTPQEVEDEE